MPVTPKKYLDESGAQDIIDQVERRSPATFVGTTAEWNALTAAQKAKYTLVNLTDDMTDSEDILYPYKVLPRGTLSARNPKKVGVWTPNPNYKNPVYEITVVVEPNSDYEADPTEPLFLKRDIWGNNDTLMTPIDIHGIMDLSDRSGSIPVTCQIPFIGCPAFSTYGVETNSKCQPYFDNQALYIDWGDFSFQSVSTLFLTITYIDFSQSI